jgi:hypothetical protein
MAETKLNKGFPPWFRFSHTNNLMFVDNYRTTTLPEPMQSEVTVDEVEQRLLEFVSNNMMLVYVP